MSTPNYDHEDVFATAWLNEQHRALNDDLRQMLDLDAGLSEIMIAAQHRELNADLATTLDLDAGLAAVKTAATTPMKSPAARAPLTEPNPKDVDPSVGGPSIAQTNGPGREHPGTDRTRGATSQLLLQVVPVDESDMEETDRISRELRGELLGGEVAEVTVLEAETIPEGAMGIAALVGWLGVSLGAARRLRAVVRSATQFAARFNRTVEIRYDDDVLKVTGISSAMQEALIAAFIARHTADS